MTPAETPSQRRFSVHDLHLAAPLQTLADSEHKPLRPLLFKLWIACRILRLGPEATFTSLILLHRYYAYRLVDEQQDWKWIGASCLLLGMKAEEEVRRLRDIINVAHMLEFSLDELKDMMIDISVDPPELNEDYWRAKENIVKTEQLVLRALSFDVVVCHPHRLVVLVANDLNLSQDSVEKAWKRLNDALFYPLALRHSALAMATAAVELEVGNGVDLYGDVVEKDELVLAMRHLNEAEDLLKQLSC